MRSSVGGVACGVCDCMGPHATVGAAGGSGRRGGRPPGVPRAVAASAGGAGAETCRGSGGPFCVSMWLVAPAIRAPALACRPAKADRPPFTGDGEPAAPATPPPAAAAASMRAWRASQSALALFGVGVLLALTGTSAGLLLGPGEGERPPCMLMLGRMGLVCGGM